MRYFILSDVHSNLESLQAVLADAGKAGYDAVVCLGDHVGYGADPNECVHVISELPKLSAVMGNHDAAAIRLDEREFLNWVARAAIDYTAAQLDEKSRSYLENLPFIINTMDDFVAVHASPNEPETWGYVLDFHQAAAAFRVMTSSIAFIGHSHFPMIFAQTGGFIPLEPNRAISFPRAEKFIVNVGSVGQPRDGDPRAAYVIYDDKKRSVELFRVEYDVNRAAEKILKAGLPVMLAERIQHGY